MNKLGTRGLIIIKRGSKGRAYYNQFDSYPTGLGEALHKQLKSFVFVGFKHPNIKNWLENEYNTSGHNKDMNWDFDLTHPLNKPNHPNIDYLFHEWIYFVEPRKKQWSCFKSMYNRSEVDKHIKDNVGGFLIPLGTFRFDQHVNFKRLLKAGQNWHELIGFYYEK